MLQKLSGVKMIELALEVATGIIFLLATFFAWESTRMVEEKKKRQKERKEKYERTRVSNR